MTFDLCIEGGTLVRSSGRHRANVYIADGRFAALSQERLPSKRHVDATGLLVMPGFVDAHVHFMDPAATDREDFPTGSKAAARAGVTTVIEHTHGAPVRTAGDLEEKAAYLADRSVVDFALGAHAWPDGPPVAGVWGAGAAFIKVFTCTTHGIPGHDAGHLERLFSQAAAADAICLVHCEDEAITRNAERRLRAQSLNDGSIVPLWRSREAELVAAELVASLARSSQARVVIAHASHLGVVQSVRQGDDARRVYVETCPQYLTLMESEVLQFGAFRKFTPPARARTEEELAEMWHALAADEIDYISSDHAPSTAAQKSAGSIWDVHFGLPGIDTTSAVLLDGAARGRITYERLVEVYAEAPARIYGLTGKGRLEVGLDADIVLVDPDARWNVNDADILSKAGWSPYSGRTLQGRPAATYLRGEQIMQGGRVTGLAGHGRFVRGSGARHGQT
jgi:dihydroorotase (multifunctional complex type)